MTKKRNFFVIYIKLDNVLHSESQLTNLRDNLQRKLFLNSVKSAGELLIIFSPPIKWQFNTFGLKNASEGKQISHLITFDALFSKLKYNLQKNSSSIHHLLTYYWINKYTKYIKLYRKLIHPTNHHPSLSSRGKIGESLGRILHYRPKRLKYNRGGVSLSSSAPSTVTRPGSPDLSHFSSPRISKESKPQKYGFSSCFPSVFVVLLSGLCSVQGGPSCAIMCATIFHTQDPKPKLDMMSFQDCVADEHWDYLFANSRQENTPKVQCKLEQTDSDEG